MSDAQRHSGTATKRREVCLRILLALVFSLVHSATLPLFGHSLAYAEVPWMINYQGRLTDSGGSSVTGAFAVTFRLYDDSTAGSKQWEEQQSVNLVKSDNGVFSVVLGASTPLGTVDFNTPLWLSVQVDQDAEMTPRQRLTATGYAMNADQIDSLDSNQLMRSDIDTSTSGTLTITRSGTALVIKPTTNPSADTAMLDIQNAAGTSQFVVDSEGDMTSGGDLQVGGDLLVTGVIAGSTTIDGSTHPTWTADKDNTGGTEPASGAGFIIEGGTGDASLLWDAANDEMDVNKDVNIAGTLNAATDLFAVDSAGTLTAGDVPWARLSGVPAGLADGDTDTTYTADGAGLELSGTEFALELDGTTLAKGASGLKVGTLTDTEIPPGITLDGTSSIAAAAIDSGTLNDGRLSANVTKLGSSIALGGETTGDYVASFTAGTGLTGDAAGAGSTPALAFASAELSDVAWGDGSAASIQHSYAVTGTDPVLTFSNGVVNVTGALQVGGQNVLTSTTGLLPIEVLTADPVAPPTANILGQTPSADFPASADTIAYFTFRVPDDCDTTQPMVLKLNYGMSTADATGDVAMVLEYEVVASGGDMTPGALTATKTDLIDPPNSAEVLSVFTGTNLRIDAAHLGGAGRNVNCKLYRDVDGTGSNHTGAFQLLNIMLTYTKSTS